MAFALDEVCSPASAVFWIGDHLEYGEIPIGDVDAGQRRVELAARWIGEVLPPTQRERLGGLADVYLSSGLLPNLVDHRR